MPKTSSENIPVHRLLVISNFHGVADRLLSREGKKKTTFKSLFALAFTAPVAKKVDWIFWDVIQHLSCLKPDCFAWDYSIIVLESKLPTG